MTLNYVCNHVTAANISKLNQSDHTFVYIAGEFIYSTCYYYNYVEAMNQMMLFQYARIN